MYVLIPWERKQTSQMFRLCGCPKLKRWLALAFAIIFIPVLKASPLLIDFDDLTPRPSNDMPRNYHGLLFSASPIFGITGRNDPNIPASEYGVVSGDNIFVSDGQSNGFQAFTPGTVFTLKSAYFSSAFNGPYDSILTIHALGFDRNGYTAFDWSFQVNSVEPTLVKFDWLGLSGVELTGGYVTYSHNQYAMDNLLVDFSPQDPASVPEPMSLAITSAGLAALVIGASARRWSAS